MNKKSSSNNSKSFKSDNGKGTNYFADTFGKKLVKKLKPRFDDSSRDSNELKNRNDKTYNDKSYNKRKKDEQGNSFDKKKSFHNNERYGDVKKRKFPDSDGSSSRKVNDSNKNDDNRNSFDKKKAFRNNDKSGFGDLKKRKFADRESSTWKDDKIIKREESKNSFEKKKTFHNNDNIGLGDVKKRKFADRDSNAWKADKSSAGKRDNNYPKRSKFTRHFDNENAYEKAYSSNSFATDKGKSFNPKSNRDVDQQEEDKGKMPLNKYVAHCGVCSRRDAVNLIKDGKIKVDGETVVEPGYKMQGGEKVELNGKVLTVQKNLVYVLMNKPKGYITTTDDPKGRRTVMDILFDHIDERLFPVGRLDRNTTGLLLLTNDGELAQKLTHPKYKMRKIYQVTLDKALKEADFDKIKQGIILEDGKTEVDQLEYLDEKNKIGIEIHSGKNRIVRRIFESLGYVVDKLDRVMYAGLTKKNVLRGKWRFLTAQEIINLKHIQ